MKLEAIHDLQVAQAKLERYIRENPPTSALDKLLLVAIIVLDLRDKFLDLQSRVTELERVASKQRGGEDGRRKLKGKKQ